MCAAKSFRASDDGSLVRRARDGDREAFGILVERYMRPGYAVALSITKRHEDAEDVVQEAFMTALKRLEECRNPERFAAWFLMIVRNRSRNLLRREGLRRTESLPETRDSGLPGPEAETEISEIRGHLEDALKELPEIQREIVLLHDLEGWTHREIAELVDLPEGTVRSHLHYARKALRRALSPIRDDGGPKDGGHIE